MSSANMARGAKAPARGVDGCSTFPALAPMDLASIARGAKAPVGGVGGGSAPVAAAWAATAKEVCCAPAPGAVAVGAATGRLSGFDTGCRSVPSPVLALPARLLLWWRRACTEAAGPTVPARCNSETPPKSLPAPLPLLGEAVAAPPSSCAAISAKADGPVKDLLKQCNCKAPSPFGSRGDSAAAGKTAATATVRSSGRSGATTPRPWRIPGPPPEGVGYKAQRADRSRRPSEEP
mmetsp:Transcript_78924/g.174831  ORF Transcript_78924/g.174831 Transcript_78924/m.174831 type:complete len:235 (+) Transcript_78924:1677-2381(+)